MKNVSLYKKIKIFGDYKKIISENSKELENKFNIRIDKAWRLYTVLNIPEELVGEAYSLKKSDIDRISENFIKSYGYDLSEYLKIKGLQELYEYYEIKKVDKYSYLLVYGFSLFKSHKYYTNLYWKVLPVGILVSIISILLIFL